MLLYKQLQAAAYKNKYETAIDYSGNRILYGRLLNEIEKVYNTFFNMKMQHKRLAVILPNLPELVYIFYAAVRLDISCIFLDIAIGAEKINELLQELNPYAVVLAAGYYQKLRPEAPNVILCRTPFCPPKLKERDFGRNGLGGLYFLDKLMAQNDFRSVEKLDLDDAAPDIYFYGGDAAMPQLFALPPFVFSSDCDVMLPSLKELEKRKKIFLPIPFHDETGLIALHSVLQCGHRCLITPDTISQSIADFTNKARPAAIIATAHIFESIPKSSAKLFCVDVPGERFTGTVFLLRGRLTAINSSLFYPAAVELEIKKIDGVTDCKCIVLDNKIKLNVTINSCGYTSATIKNSPAAKAAFRAANRLVGGYTCGKSIKLIGSS